MPKGRTQAMGCLGCEAREAQIASLQAQVERLEDKLMATANPHAYQLYKGQPVSVAPSGAVSGEGPWFKGEDGKEYQLVSGRQVSREEYEHAMTRLEDQMSGRASFESGPGASLPL